MSINFKTKKSGFTLIEIILYIGLTSFILAAIGTMITILYQVNNRFHTISEVNQEGISILQTLTYELQNSETIATPTRGNTAANISFLRNTGDAASNTFSLTSSNLIWTTETAQQFNLNSNKVNISNLNFSNYSQIGSTTTVIRFRFTVTYKNPGGKVQNDYSKTFYGSAYKR